MAWWMKKPVAEQLGSVLFPAKWPWRLEDFAFEKKGIEVGRVVAASDHRHWSAELVHPVWGSAAIRALPDGPMPDRILIDVDPRLTDDEKAAIVQAGSSVVLSAGARDGNVLTDRKKFLRFLHAAMGADGLAVVDHTAQAFWSPAGLEDELSHDADLDIDAIYTMHVLGDEANGGAYWQHSHGLKEIGFWDFDILDPAEELSGLYHDLARLIAFGVVEERFKLGGDPFEIIRGVEVVAVPAREFSERAPKGEYARYRRDQDEEHREGHGVVCEPRARGFMSRLHGGDRPRASRFLQGPFPEEVLIPFSVGAGELMARRAAQMLPLLRGLVDELADREVMPLVKLGYVTDGGGPDDREHLWFEVHGFRGNDVDATLINQPFNVARLQKDQRGLYPLDLLSDWSILTPFGTIDPRQTRTLRNLRANIDRLPARGSAAPA